VYLVRIYGYDLHDCCLYNTTFWLFLEFTLNDILSQCTKKCSNSLIMCKRISDLRSEPHSSIAPDRYLLCLHDKKHTYGKKYTKTRFFHGFAPFRSTGTHSDLQRQSTRYLPHIVSKPPSLRRHRQNICLRCHSQKRLSSQNTKCVKLIYSMRRASQTRESF
jgi:hypothetical protein